MKRLFVYRALDAKGQLVTGESPLADPEILAERLHATGLHPLEIRRARVARQRRRPIALRLLHPRGPLVRPRALALYTRQFATLMRAGEPITRALRVLARQTDSAPLARTTLALSRAVASGTPLHDAMRRHPRVFDPLYLGLVRLGEMSGGLDEALMRIADVLDRRAWLRGKIRSAVVYPCTVALIAALITIFLVWKVMPKFSAAFQEAGKELPALTAGLIRWSEAIRANAVLVLILLMLLLACLRWMGRRPWGRLALDRATLRVPVLGTLCRKTAMARFARTLSTLMAAGVPILQALDIVRGAAGNAVLSRALGRAHLAIVNGESLHTTFAMQPVFPPLLVQMVAVGEECGEMTRLLTRMADLYEREVDDTVKALASIIEPVMIVLVGTIVGLIAVAVFLPLVS
ncbi:MAG: type II secretion system F family protein [Candidatus Sumerlaeia bacterium]|nr:type II secretion system F family protein [Candidatus Sumerlaeia bacterium]